MTGNCCTPVPLSPRLSEPWLEMISPEASIIFNVLCSQVAGAGPSHCTSINRRQVPGFPMEVSGGERCFRRRPPPNVQLRNSKRLLPQAH